MSWGRQHEAIEQLSPSSDEKFSITVLESNTTAGTILSRQAVIIILYYRVHTCMSCSLHSYIIRLEIRNVSDDDFGVYICNVSNSVDIPVVLRGSIIQTATTQLILQRKLVYRKS